MKSIILSVLFCAAAAAGDPRLRIEPAQPHPGDTLTITYDPKTGPLEKAGSYTLVYGFQSYANLRAPIQVREGKLQAEVKAPRDAAYFWCWVEGKSAEEQDTNRGGVWDTYFYDSKGLPVESARRLRAELYQMRKQAPDRDTIQLLLLEEELRAFPTNGRTRAEWWVARYEDAGKTTAARDEILHEIGVFMDSNLDHPWAYEAASLGYNRLNRNPLAVELMRTFVRRFPDDPSLDGRIGFFFGNWGTLADLENLPKASKRWAATPEYAFWLFNATSKFHAGPEKLLIAGRQWLALVPKEKDDFGDTRRRVAEEWLNAGVDPKAAEEVAREAVAISEIGEKPGNIPNLRRNRNASKMWVPVHRSTVGWALFQQGRYGEALTEFQRAVEIRAKEKTDTPDLFYRLGRTLEKLDRPTEAADAYLRELAFGRGEPQVRTALAGVYAKVHSGAGEVDTEIRSRVNDLVAQAADPENEAIEEVNEKMGRFELRGLDGKEAPLAQYRGKVVIIDFWATWCAPCLADLESTHKLEQQYPGQIAVLAVSVDAGDTQPRAPEYLKKKGYDFVLLFDDEHRRDLPVPYVPSRFVVDREGRLRIREFGTSNAQEMMFQQKVRALMGADSVGK